MNIEQFISKLESSDAYQNNKAVRSLVSESRQVLIDLADGGDRDAFMAEFVKFKDRLDECLNSGISKSNVEKEKIFESLKFDEQYLDRLNTLSDFGFFEVGGSSKEGDALIPGMLEVFDSFTPEMLKLAVTFQEPTLLLVPECSFAAKVEAIDAHKFMEGQIDTYQDDLYKKSDSGSEKIAGWKAVIVDGAKEMKLKEGDDPNQRFDKRVEARKVARRPGEKGVERHAYVLLMMESLRKGEPTEMETYTLLDDDPALSASGVPDADWDDDNRQVHFGAYGPERVSDLARFRSSVGGDVLMNAVESSESTTETYTVEVDYDLTLAEVIKAGKFESVNSSIRSLFYSDKEGKETVVIELVHLDSDIGTDEALGELDKRGYRPATVFELAALGAAKPDLQKNFPILSLASSAQAPTGKTLWPILDKRDGDRIFNLVWGSLNVGEWTAHTRFAAVRR